MKPLRFIDIKDLDQISVSVLERLLRRKNPVTIKTTTNDPKDDAQYAISARIVQPRYTLHEQGSRRTCTGSLIELDGVFTLNGFTISSRHRILRCDAGMGRRYYPFEHARVTLGWDSTFTPHEEVESALKGECFPESRHREDAHGIQMGIECDLGFYIIKAREVFEKGGKA